MTDIQAAGLAEGIPLQIVRPNEPAGAIRNLQVVTDAVTRWRDGLLSWLGVAEPMGEEDPKAE